MARAVMDKTVRRLLRSFVKMLRARLALPALAALVVLAVGCSNNGEGERCSRQSYGDDSNGANGKDDCQTGLICVASQSANTDICCPPDPKNATVLACVPGSGSRPADGGAEGGDAASDAGDAGPDVSTDGGTEAATEAGPDATTEAATEASTEAGEAADDGADAADDADATDAAGDATDDADAADDGSTDAATE
jgi:hypothetical protein